jgi:integrase/recombinase XerD
MDPVEGEIFMNHRPPGLETVKAIQGFLQYKSAEGLSVRTIESYERDLRQWVEYQGEMDVAGITAQHLRQYLSYLLTDYTPRRLTGRNEEKLSPKTVRNVWVTLSAFFHWASDEFQIPNPMKMVPAPKFEDAPVEPFTREQIEALLKACDFCQEAQTSGRRKFTMHRVTGFRDKAIILVLLDSGLRASELCALRIGDYDSQSGKVQVRHGVAGGAKGKKGRTVYLGKSARRAIWRYLAAREDGEDSDAPLFLGRYSRPLNRDALRQVIASLGEKAAVKKAYPHRFRHTFAITYLRSGGDLFSLQRMLGHATLEMVQHYARIADIDVEQAHRKASPADNWRL